MTNTKFTPGPWSHQPLGKRDIKAVKDGKQGVIATVTGYFPWSDDGLDEREANAALIKAAPDLYKAAEEIIEYVRLGIELAKMKGFDDVAAERTKKLDALEKALAKARGEL